MGRASGVHALFLAAIVAAAGCDFRNDKTGSVVQPLGRSVTYAELKQKVLQPSCIGCHMTQNPPLETYPAAFKAGAAVRKAVFDEKSMPKQGELTAEQKQLLLAWLDGGMPEGLPAPEPSQQPSSMPVRVTWSDVKSKVLDVACSSCHFPGNPKNVSDLTNEDFAKSDIGSIVGLSLSDLMPPPESSRPLSVEQKRFLTEWWIAGMPDPDTPAPRN